MATEVVKTIRSSGGDYTSLSGWEAGEQADLVTADEIAVAECYNDWPSGLSDRLLIGASWTTDGTRGIIIRAAAGEDHNGDIQDGFRLVATGWSTKAIDGGSNNVALLGLNIQHPSSSGGGVQGCWTAERCIIHGRTAGTSGTGHLARSTGTSRNNVILRFTTYGVRGQYSQAAIVENCTVADCGTAFDGNNVDLVAKNCVAYNNTTSYGAKVNTSSSTNNAADDASTNTPPGSNPITTDIVSGDFTDAANDDYSLASGSTLIDAGADLSSDFTDDILGETRGATWDVGAFEYISTGAPPTLVMQGYSA